MALHFLDGLRSDQYAITALYLALSYGGWAWRTVGPLLLKVRRFITPLLLVAVIYDSMRFYGDYLRGRVRVDEPYLFDKHWFGITGPDGTILTPNEWWQLNTHWTLDLVTGFFYLTFIAIFVGIAGYYYFWLPRKGTKRMSGVRIAREAPQVMWNFFWVNMIGYSTYYWYPAAPPWYVSNYGLGPANMDAQANPAGCIRFDELLGTEFFTGMYGRSADVFGAIPSLHIAYPLTALLFAHRFGSLRVFSWIFYLVMCFAAVYLNHHYILDLIWGSAYSVLVFVVIRWMSDRGWIYTRDSTRY